MRIDIDGKGGPDALHRAKLRKVVGRKHNHQPRGHARERDRQQMLTRQRHLLRLRKAFNKMVAAYWRGEREGYPDAPPS